MGEAVQNPLRGQAAAQILDCQPVVFLVQEKAGFLAVLHVHQVADAVFHDLHFGVKWLPDEAFKTFHALLKAHLGVAALVHAADVHAVLCQNLQELVQDHRL